MSIVTNKSGDEIMAEGSFAARLGFKLGFNGVRYPVRGTNELRTGWIYGRATQCGCHIQAYTEATDEVIANNTVNALALNGF